MGYMEVGSTRYFDVREVNDYYFPVRILPSFSLIFILLIDLSLWIKCP